MGGTSNPANPGYNPEKTTRPTLHLILMSKCDFFIFQKNKRFFEPMIFLSNEGGRFIYFTTQQVTYLPLLGILKLIFLPAPNSGLKPFGTHSGPNQSNHINHLA